MATLTTIPLEILLLILRKLDTVDVVRLGMTCRDLHGSTQTRHVWLDQAQNHRRRTVALKFWMPLPTTLPTEALKRFAILQAKLRVRWNRVPDQDSWEKLQFAARGTTLLPGMLDLVLLPGGEFVISIDQSEGDISLHRIQFSGGHLSLIWLTDLPTDRWDNVTWNKLLPAMAPNPVFCYARANSVHLFGISPEGGVHLEAEFPIPNRSTLLWVNGQGRMAGFVFQTGSESPVVTIVHLDRPGVTLEIRLPPDCGELVKGLPTPEPRSGGGFGKVGLSMQVEGSWKVCFPTPDLAVISGGNYVLGYALPPFSTFPDGKHSLDGGPRWRLLVNTTGTHPHKTSAEVFYDPSLPDRRYNIHFLRQLDDFDPRSCVGLITLTIDPSDSSSSSSGTPAYQRIESSFWIDGIIANGTLHSDIYHSRTRSHGEGLDIWVTSLEDASISQAGGEGGQGSIFMFVSNDELEPDMEWESVDLDEASGRVFIWGPTYRWMTPPETRVFVGELVSSHEPALPTLR